MSTEVALKLDQSRCIVEKVHLTTTVYHNICTGTQEVISNTIVDYFCFGVLGVVCLLLIVFVCTFIKMICEN